MCYNSGATPVTAFQLNVSSVCKSCADILCVCFVLQKGSNINLIQPQSSWIKPTVQRPKWPPAMGTVLSIGTNLLDSYPSKQGVTTCTRCTYLRRLEQKNLILENRVASQPWRGYRIIHLFPFIPSSALAHSCQIDKIMVIILPVVIV